MLAVWHAPIQRPTRDIDLLGKLDNKIDAVTEAIRDICSVKVDPDGIVFDLDNIKAAEITEDAEYHGIRVKFEALLERTKVPLQVDIGFGDPVVPKASMVSYPAILDMPAPRLRGYSRESSVAEKLEAITKRGTLNSRVKDLYDIWLLSRQFEFEGAVLAKAVSGTFKSRDRAINPRPAGLTSTFYTDPSHQSQWKAFVKRNRLVNAPDSLETTVKAIGKFVFPILDGLTGAAPPPSRWIPSGSWLS
jgi:hypothetical protein